MAHKPGHPNEKMISFMDSLNIKNSAIKRMAATKKIDSLMSTGPGGMPYYKFIGNIFLCLSLFEPILAGIIINILLIILFLADHILRFFFS